jgi:hypothetical protein
MAKKTAPSTIPAERLEAYDRLIATRPGIERNGATIPYTSLNGHMTSYLADTGSLVLRLSPDDRARFLDEQRTTLHTAYGTVQKAFVDVPDTLFLDTTAIAPWFAASLDWIATLRPKPTKRSG